MNAVEFNKLRTLLMSAWGQMCSEDYFNVASHQQHRDILAKCTEAWENRTFDLLWVGKCDIRTYEIGTYNQFAYWAGDREDCCLCDDSTCRATLEIIERKDT